MTKEKSHDIFFFNETNLTIMK